MSEKIWVFLVCWMIGIAGCQPFWPPPQGRSEPEKPAPPQSTRPATTPTEADTSQLTPITLSVGFVPNVQFAPFYVAIAKGFYAAQGLDVTLEYGFEHDFLQLLAAGERPFVVASGDQVILARSRGLPVVYVMNWHRRFPIAVFSLDELKHPADLVGKKVGIPGLFGASYIGWQALLYASGIAPEQITLEAIGFTQVEAVVQGKVDAAVGYAVNEPVQLAMAGYEPYVILVADYIDLVANGIVTTETLIAQQPARVQGIVTGSLQGLRYTIEHPQEAFEIVLQFVPEAAEQRETQMRVLQKSIEFWVSDRLGFSNPEAWEVSQQFMLQAGLIPQPVELKTLFTNQFVEEAAGQQE